jgi:hypothetical protein
MTLTLSLHNGIMDSAYWIFRWTNESSLKKKLLRATERIRNCLIFDFLPSRMTLASSQHNDGMGTAYCLAHLSQVWRKSFDWLYMYMYIGFKDKKLNFPMYVLWLFVHITLLRFTFSQTWVKSFYGYRIYRANKMETGRLTSQLTVRTCIYTGMRAVSVQKQYPYISFKRLIFTCILQKLISNQADAYTRQNLSDSLVVHIKSFHFKSLSPVRCQNVTLLTLGDSVYARMRNNTYMWDLLKGFPLIPPAYTDK